MNPSDGPSDQPPANKNVPLILSLEILDALGKAGMAIVPRIPTPRMIDAGSRALEDNGNRALAVYQAMLEAAD